MDELKLRILKLCKRLDRFMFEDIQTIADDVELEVLELLLETLIAEKKLIRQGEIYFYSKEKSNKTQYLGYPQIFQYHSKDEIDYILKGFCADVEVIKMMDLFGISKNVMDKVYQKFRTIIYEKQLKELKTYLEKKPKIPQERIYMNTKAYLYLYNNKLYVSENYLVSKNSVKHTNEERLEIKNIYLRSYRKVLSRSFAHRFHLHLAEEIWKYGKDFNERYSKLKNLLFS